METQLAAYQRPDDQNLKSYEHPHTHTVALQQELDATRDRYKKQVADLEEQVSQLNSQLQQAHRIQEGKAYNSHLQQDRLTETRNKCITHNSSWLSETTTISVDIVSVQIFP